MTRRFWISSLLIALLSAVLCVAGVSNGAKAVTSAGTAEALSATSIPVVEVVIQAELDNTGNVYVGGSTVSSTSGVELEPGASLTFGNIQKNEWFNLNEIYIDAATSSDGVKFTYTTKN